MLDREPETPKPLPYLQKQSKYPTYPTTPKGGLKFGGSAMLDRGRANFWSPYGSEPTGFYSNRKEHYVDVLYDIFGT